MDLALSEGNGESRYPFDDLSWHRIEAYGQYGLELAGKSGRLELLASLLRLAAEQTVQHQYAKVHEVVALLEQHHLPIFQRLALFLLSLFPQQEHIRVTNRLTDRQLFENANLRREYVQLLQAGFSELDPVDQETILGWIEEGPADMERLSVQYEQNTGQSLTDEEKKQYRETWQRDWYARLDAALPEKYRERYGRLVQDHGEARLPEVHPRSVATAIAMETYSPLSIEGLHALPIRDLVRLLKTWQPVPGENIFYQDRSYQGMREALTKAVTRDPQYFAKYARQFRALSPHYIEAILDGLLQATRQQQPFSWEPVLTLCLSVAHKRYQPRRGTAGGMRWHNRWKGACFIITELLSFCCESNPTPIPFSLRPQLWAILAYLAEDPEPPRIAPHAEAPEKEEMDLVLSMVRGRALFGVLAFARWIARVWTDEGTAGSAPQHRWLARMPEVQQVLERHLDVTLDPTPAIRSFYGQSLPALAELDRDWTERNIDRIFPAEEASRSLRDTVWNAYCVLCNPSAPMLQLLEREYDRAIDQLSRVKQAEGPYDPHRRLAEHLVLLYCWGHLAYDEPGGLLERLFTSAPVALRAHAFDYLGHLLVRHEGPIDANVLSRLQSLWEWRVAALTQDPGVRPIDAGELAPFRWWFNSGLFPDIWALTQLETMLRVNGTIDAPFSVVGRLALVCAADPFLSIRCLSLLVLNARDEWRPTGWAGWVRTILLCALESEHEEAHRLATEVIHRLGALGEDYRDLLSSRDASPR